jgi:hypothetical protein
MRFSARALAFIAALTLILLAFRRAGVLAAVTVEHYHDPRGCSR